MNKYELIELMASIIAIMFIGLHYATASFSFIYLAVVSAVIGATALYTEYKVDKNKKSEDEK